MISRDPNDYFPTQHAVIRKKERGIDWCDISRTIENGEINRSHKDNCKLLLQEFEVYEHPVGVVVNYETGHILTVELRKDE